MTPATTPVLPSLPGYTITRHLAEGGMAEVFVATQHSLGREVAVKIMKDGDATVTERFQREARLVGTLNHSHIVHIYDVGQLEDGRPYISMELLPGGDLRQRVRDGLKGSEVLRIMRQLAAGLQAVHERGVIHRDIKPANILFRDNGDAVLTDFGIAKVTDIDVELTHVGVVVGSPAYSSPEQISSKPLDGRSDLYSLGVVLVEMLIGRNPFRGPDYASTVVNQMQESSPMLPAWHAAWQPVLDRLLAKKPEQRYADAATLAAVLETLDVEPPRLLEDSDCTTTQLHTAMNPVLPVTARRWRYRLVGLVVLLLALAGVSAWLHYRPDPHIGTWLTLGGERLREERLSAPAGDSAAFYYQQVLALQPDNPQAKQGLAAVARRHAELAHQAHEKGDLETALGHVRDGLKAVPDDPALQVLAEEIPAAMARQQADQALRARLRGDLEGALMYVGRGLDVKPDDSALLAMREELQTTIRARETQRAERDRVRREQKQLAQAQPAAPATEPSARGGVKGFFSRLFGH